jgi:hypothetical protein
MARWTGEEVYEGLQRWLKTRRDEYPRNPHGGDGYKWDAVDSLLDEVRDEAAQGWMPWQRLESDGE